MLKWPVATCTNCGFDLSKQEPQEKEKGFDENHQPIFTDFCRKCGTGYQVSEREIIVARQVSSRVMGEDTPTTPVPAVKIIPEGFYFCPKCKLNHNAKSGVGKRHLKFKET